MTVAEAEELRTVFGPCTAMYECTEPQELAEDHQNMPLEEAAWFEYDLESVRIDRQQICTDNDAEIKELGEFLAALKQRVTERYGARK